jgi:hypothetical protein
VTIPLGRKTPRVVEVRGEDADQPPTLVVEDLSGPATSKRGLAESFAKSPLQATGFIAFLWRGDWSAPCAFSDVVSPSLLEGRCSQIADLLRGRGGGVGWQTSIDSLRG